MRISGIVQRGKRRGKQLGFPTANIPLIQTLPEGIYISTTNIDGTVYHSLTFIGSAKTFDETTYQAETFILDFDQDIYEKEITIDLLKKIRDNKKFDSEVELVKQMEDDRIVALSYFKDETNK